MTRLPNRCGGAASLNRHSLPTLYDLACAYARTGREAESLTILRDLVAARVDFGMADDEDLASLRDAPEFQRLIDALERDLQPISSSSRRFTIEQLGLVPEGIAYDAATARLFFGSMRTGDVYVFDAAGGLSKFATVDSSGSLSAIGMSVDDGRDTRRRHLLCRARIATRSAAIAPARRDRPFRGQNYRNGRAVKLESLLVHKNKNEQ